MPEQIKLKPCTFCEGPPVPIVTKAEYPYGVLDPKEITESGIFVKAYVFCHECGAQSEKVEGDVYDEDDVLRLEREAVELWQNRDNRHRRLYDGGEAEGLNYYPRANEVAHG